MPEPIGRRRVLLLSRPAAYQYLNKSNTDADRRNGNNVDVVTVRDAGPRETLGSTERNLLRNAADRRRHLRD